MVGKLLEYQAFALCIGLGQVTPCDLFAQAQMVGLFTVRIQCKHQIPQTVPVGQLAEHHAQQLVPAGEMFHVPIAPVPEDDRIKHSARKKIRQLSENIFALVHVNRFWQLT